MSESQAVVVKGLGKRYALGVTSGFTARGFHNRRTTTAQALVEAMKRRRQNGGENREFWALKDINFELAPGEVVGLVGRNGAGKSTMLKILTRITDLTEGRIDLWGRVGSLLEVGTGFHPELTGRENIYLNGSLLGMRRPEIDQEFDAIVDFAGVETFLDTPVKRFSSGMSVRLAFSIASHLRADILLVDEVLSVGDKAFRDKCLGKLDDVSHSGRTIVYVSHLMETVTQLCTRALLLERGHLTMDDDVDPVVAAYVARQGEQTNLLEGMDDRPGIGAYRFIDAKVGSDSYASHEAKEIEFTIERRPSNFSGRFHVQCQVVDQRQTVVAFCDSRLVEYELYPAERHRGRLVLRTPWLKPGRYRIDLSIVGSGGRTIDEAVGAAFMEVLPRHPYPGSAGRQRDIHGSVFADFDVEPLTENDSHQLPATEWATNGSAVAGSSDFRTIDFSESHPSAGTNGHSIHHGVLSDPASTAKEAADALPPADWYPDPSGRPGLLRYWDGTDWTPNYAGRPFPGSSPAGR